MLPNRSPSHAALLLALCAIPSALLSNFLSLEWHVKVTSAIDFGGPPLPGLYFGLVLCIAVAQREGAKPVKLAITLAATIVAWLCAWTTGYQVWRYIGNLFPGGSSSDLDPYIYPVAGFVAGIVGSAITAAGIAVASAHFRRPADWARTIVIGGVAGLLLEFATGFETVLPLLLVWQPAVAASIAYAMASAASTSAPPAGAAEASLAT